MRQIVRSRCLNEVPNGGRQIFPGIILVHPYHTRDLPKCPNAEIPIYHQNIYKYNQNRNTAHKAFHRQSKCDRLIKGSSLVHIQVKV